MASLVEIGFVNALSATLLAMCVWLIATHVRRPAVVHTLWLIVLLKLVSPQILSVGVMPSFEQLRERLPLASWSNTTPADRVGVRSTSLSSNSMTDTAQPQASAVVRPNLRSFPAEASTPEEQRASMQLAPRRIAPAQLVLRLAVTFAAAGTILLLGVSISRVVRFRRYLRDIPEAPPALQARVARLAQSFGIRGIPRVRVLPDRIPPSLWPGSHPCEILVPRALLAHLSPEECDTLLAHELAHVRRRDHWIRPLELMIVALYWWLPVAWWARRNLRRAEEEACDALVVQKLPNCSRVYAESLLKTVEFLAQRDQSVPLLATGVTGIPPLKERIIMILKRNTSNPLPKRLRSLVYTAMLLPLLVSPAWVKGPQTSREQQPNSEQAYQQEMMTIEEEMLAIQRQLRELEQRRMHVQAELQERMFQRELRTLREEAAALEKAGKQAEADELRERTVAMERENTMQRAEREVQQSYEEKRMRIDFELQEIRQEQRAAETKGDLKLAQELAMRALELEKAFRRLELDMMQSELDRNRQRFEREKAELNKLEP